MNKQEIEKAIEYWKEFKSEISDLKRSHPTMEWDSQEKATELAISALGKQLNNGWIPVSQKLPKRQEVVLQVTMIRVSDNYKWVQNLLWNHDEWKWWEEDDKEVDVSRFKILAWQSLPEKYTEASDE